MPENKRKPNNNNRRKPAKPPQRQRQPRNQERKGTGVGVSTSRKQSGRRAQISTRQKSTQVKHTEYLTTVESKSTAFQSWKVHVQPGTFPWLSDIAQRFEHYRVKTLKFRFVSAVATTTAGNIAMYMDYECHDDFAVDMSRFMANKTSKIGRVWDALAISASVPDIHSNGRRKRIRGDEHVQDYNDYDAGRLHVAIEGVPAGMAGNIYMDYELELFVPQQPGQAARRITNVSFLELAANSAMATGVPLIPDHTLLAAKNIDDLDLAAKATPTHLVLPKGTYKITSTGTFNGFGNTAGALHYMELKKDGATIGSVSHNVSLHGAGDKDHNVVTDVIHLVCDAEATIQQLFVSTFAAGTVNLVKSALEIVGL